MQALSLAGSTNTIAPALVTLGNCTLDVQARRLSDAAGVEVELRPQAMELLCVLASPPNMLVTKEQLLQAVWPGMVVTDDSIVQAVGDVRRALGDADHRIVQTVPKRGYRLCTERAREPAATQAPAPVRKPALKRRHIVAIGLASGCAAAAGVAWTLLPRAAPVARRAPSVAVVPFTVLTSGPGDKVLSIGMAESVAGRLSSAPGLTVQAVPFVTYDLGGTHDPVMTGRELDADWVVHGGFHRAGQQIRISATLTRSLDGTIAWHGVFSDDLAGIFRAQRSIASQVAARVLPSRAQADSPRALEERELGGTDSLEAYRLYLAALLRYRWGVAEDVAEAGLLLREALQIDPDYALAWSLLAACHRHRLFSEEAEPAEVFDQVRPALSRALLLEPTLPQACTEQALMNWWYDFDWEGSAKTFRDVIARAPNETGAWLGLGMLQLSTRGEIDEGLRHLRTARALDRTSPVLSFLEAHYLLEAGRLDEGAARAQHILRSYPRWWAAHASQASVEFARGRHEEGLASLRTAAGLARNSARGKAVLAVHLARLGHRDEAGTILEELAELNRTRFVPPTALGAVQAALGDTGAALSSLELAAAVHDWRIVCVKCDQSWKSLRAEPRFAGLVGQLKLGGYGKGIPMPLILGDAP